MEYGSTALRSYTLSSGNHFVLTSCKIATVEDTTRERSRKNALDRHLRIKSRRRVFVFAAVKSSTRLIGNEIKHFSLLRSKLLRCYAHFSSNFSSTKGIIDGVCYGSIWSNDPSSDTPFEPNSVVGDGVFRWTTSALGTSKLVGKR